MTNEQAFAELYFSKKAIKDVLGVTVRCWRPPYGDVDDRIRWIAQALDMETVMCVLVLTLPLLVGFPGQPLTTNVFSWTDDTFDYDWVTLGMPAIRKNYQAIFDKQTAGAYSTAGAIVLTHEIDNGTMQLSEEMLPQMMKQFTGGVMPVGVCMKCVCRTPLPVVSTLLTRVSPRSSASSNTQPYVEKDAYTYPNYDQWTAGTRSISLALPTATGQASETLVLLTGSAAPTTTSSASLSASAKNTSAVASGSSASRVAAASASASSASAAAAQQANAQKAHSGASSVHTVAGVAALLAGAVAGAAALI